MEFNFRTRIFIVLSLLIVSFHQMKHNFLYIYEECQSEPKEFFINTFSQKYERYVGDALEHFIRGEWVLVAGNLDDEMLLTRKNKLNHLDKPRQIFDFTRTHKVYLKSTKRYLDEGKLFSYTQTQTGCWKINEDKMDIYFGENYWKDFYFRNEYQVKLLGANFMKLIKIQNQRYSAYEELTESIKH